MRELMAGQRVVTFKLDADLARELLLCAALRGKTRSQLIRELVLRFLEECEPPKGRVVRLDS